MGTDMGMQYTVRLTVRPHDGDWENAGILERVSVGTPTQHEVTLGFGPDESLDFSADVVADNMDEAHDTAMESFYQLYFVESDHNLDIRSDIRTDVDLLSVNEEMEVYA